MPLMGKVAFVTGAGSGIGKAAAVLLAQQGARAAALSHTASEVEQTVAEISQDGNEAIATVADISQEDQMQKAVQQVIDRWGRIDIVFANAGINGVSLYQMRPVISLVRRSGLMVALRLSQAKSV